MNRKLVVIIIAIVAVIGSGVAYLMLADTEKQSSRTNQSEERSDSAAKDSPTEMDSETPATASGQYVDYEEDAIATTQGTKLIFFHAPWCPQCRALEADIRAEGVPENVTIFKLDYDTNQALRQKYGVTLQTTIVKVDDKGELIEKFVAYDEPTLESVKENLL